MKLVISKPHLDTDHDRTAFFRLFASELAKGKNCPKNKQAIKSMVKPEDFAPFIRRDLLGSALHLVELPRGWQCHFEALYQRWYTDDAVLLILLLAKPKLDKLVLDPGHFTATINQQLANCFVGIPNLKIKEDEYRPAFLIVLQKMAPHLLNLECSYEYLYFDMAPMKLDTYKGVYVDRLEFGLDPLFSSKHQVRRIWLSVQSGFEKNQLVKSNHLVNPFVEELVLEMRSQNRFSRLPSSFLKLLPNLKCVFHFMKICLWHPSLDDELKALVDYAKECVRQSLNLQFIFDIECFSYYDRSLTFEDLRHLEFFDEKKHSIVTKMELKNDLHFNSCQCFKCDDDA